MKYRASFSVVPNMMGTSSAQPGKPAASTSSSGTGTQTRLAGVWTFPGCGTTPLTACDALRIISVGNAAQFIDCSCANQLHETLRCRLRSGEGPWRGDGTRLKACALHDGAMKQSARTARRQQCADRPGSRGLPEDRDVLRIAAKCPNILS